MYIPYGHQTITEEDIQAVVDVLRSDYLTTGPAIGEFEQKVAAYTGAKYAVAVSNGTAALHIACLAAGIGPGDEVITTPITFAASANCVLYCGGKPVFADIDPVTYNIDPASIEQKITPRTKAILPVHFTGQPCEMEEIHRIAREHGLLVIEDAAHALGAAYKGQKIGSLPSDMVAFSFHPVKPITTGEGGMVVTDDGDLYERLCLFRSHGITRAEGLMGKQEGGWYYEQIGIGMNYRMTDMQAALLGSQLDKLDLFSDRRKEIVKMYDRAFTGMPGIIVQKEIPWSDTVRHLYLLQLDLEVLEAGRKEVFDALTAENIGCNVHYIPVYHLPYYRRLGYGKGLCPKAERLYERLITIPLFYGMTDEDVQKVILAVERVIAHYKK